MPSQQAQAVKALGLIHRYAQRTGEAWLGQKTIARIMAEKAGREPAKFGDRQVRRYRALLEQDGFLESRQNASHYRTNLYRVTPAGELVLKAGAGAFARPRRHRQRPSKSPGREPVRPSAAPPPEGDQHVRPDAPKNVRQAFPHLEGDTTPPTPPSGGRGQALRSKTRREATPRTETELRDTLLSQGKPMAVVVDALEQLRQAKLKHGVGNPWRYVQAIIGRLEREQADRQALEEKRREEDRARQRELQAAMTTRCTPHGVADCQACRLQGLELMRTALGLRKSPPASSEKPGAGVVLPDRSAADVPAEGVGGTVSGHRHDGVLTASQPGRGGAKPGPERVPSVAPSEPGSRGHARHGLTDVPRGHGVGTQVAVPVHGANEWPGLKLRVGEPRAKRSDGACDGVTLVREPDQTPLPSLVRFPSGERDEKPFRSVLDMFNAKPREVVTARANDKPKRQDEPVPLSTQCGGKGVSHSENVSGVQGLRLLLGGAQAVANAGKHVRDETGTRRAFQPAGPVGLGDGRHLALDGGHLVTGGAQVGDVPPDGVGVCGERLQASSSTPEPEGLQVQPVGLSSGLRPGTGSELVRFSVQALQVHGGAYGGVLDENKSGCGDGIGGHEEPRGLNAQTFKPLEVHKDHTVDPRARRNEGGGDA